MLDCIFLEVYVGEWLPGVGMNSPRFHDQTPGAPKLYQHDSMMSLINTPPPLSLLVQTRSSVEYWCSPHLLLVVVATAVSRTPIFSSDAWCPMTTTRFRPVTAVWSWGLLVLSCVPASGGTNLVTKVCICNQIYLPGCMRP